MNSFFRFKMKMQEVRQLRKKLVEQTEELSRLEKEADLLSDKVTVEDMREFLDKLIVDRIIREQVNAAP